MNKTGVKTYEKVVNTIRLPVDTYLDLLDVVQAKKRECHAYSINEYLTEIIENDIRDSKKSSKK